MARRIDRDLVDAGLAAVGRAEVGESAIFTDAIARRAREGRVEEFVPMLRSAWRKVGKHQEDRKFEDIFIAAALREAGFPVRLILGREIAPAYHAATYFTWVEHQGAVVTTGVDVCEIYEAVLAIP